MKDPILYGSVHLLFYRNDQALLLKRQNTGFSDGMWSVIAGRMDGGEEVKAAAVREAQEEAGLILEESDLEVIGVLHRNSPDSEWIDFFLRVHSWREEPVNMEPHKCAELRWFPLGSLPENTIPFIKKALLRKDEPLWFDSRGWQ
jgi:8-oxo-dGTP diphosphatase